mmetsp:Transcript_46915/g.109396  ORF Transcript_46915/g.109396 Transcript_46915/m.109396 type:complete len:249 (-) Transcript_46915:4105-4851(-)
MGSTTNRGGGADGLAGWCRADGLGSNGRKSTSLLVSGPPSLSNVKASCHTSASKAPLPLPTAGLMLAQPAETTAVMQKLTNAAVIHTEKPAAVSRITSVPGSATTVTFSGSHSCKACPSPKASPTASVTAPGGFTMTFMLDTSADVASARSSARRVVKLSTTATSVPLLAKLSSASFSKPPEERASMRFCTRSASSRPSTMTTKLKRMPPSCNRLDVAWGNLLASALSFPTVPFTSSKVILLLSTCKA